MKLKTALTVLALAVAGTAAAADIRSVDAVAATAGNSVITQREVSAAVAELRRTVPAAAKADDAELRPYAVEQLVNRALMVEAGKRRGIRATDAEIAEAAKTIKGSRQKVADDIVMEKVRQQAIMQYARASDAEVEAALAEAQKNGQDIPLSEPVKQYRAQHILIRAEKAEAADAAEAAARKVWQLARNGQDFASLAREYSQDGSAQNGGDLGWFGDGVMVPEFEAAVHKLKAGHVSAPVKTQFGWHIIKLNDVRESGSEDERRRSTVRKAIEQQKAAAATQQLVQQLREAAYVDIRK
ncbi:MAG: peptidylprolyl isomerase [Neisseria sp.]|nr:peptidylprolyl isomerase [Neisseria sp.]